MVIGSAGNNVDVSGKKTFAKCLCVLYNILLIYFEIIAQCFLEANCLCGDDMHQRSALDARENGFVEVILLRCFLVGHDHTASGSS